MRLLLTSLFFFFTPSPAIAGDGGFCSHEFDSCGLGKKRGSSPSPSSSGSKIKVNPSAVPVESGFGIEALTYQGDVDLNLVKGFGRVGAAISPSANEETFFGAPAFETNAELLSRKDARDKYVGSKFTLATAVNLISNKQPGMKRFEINFGVLAKYDMQTSKLTPGAGLTGVLGPFTFGYASYQDRSHLGPIVPGNENANLLNYTVSTYNAGIFLNSVILDHSVMQVIADSPNANTNTNTKNITITALTLTLLIQKGIFTISKRTEVSARSSYNFFTRKLEFISEKSEYFLGAQASLNKNLVVGVFHNYYLLRETSFGVTYFF